MMHTIDNVIYGVDFRKHLDKHKPETLEQMAARIWDDLHLPDTSPSEIVPSEDQPA